MVYPLSDPERMDRNSHTSATVRCRRRQEQFAHETNTPVAHWLWIGTWALRHSIVVLAGRAHSPLFPWTKILVWQTLDGHYRECARTLCRRLRCDFCADRRKTPHDSVEGHDCRRLL